MSNDAHGHALGRALVPMSGPGSDTEAMKILVVDDERTILNNLTRMLRLENYEVRAAANGREALNLVKEFKPDLVLCDVMMPELDGFGVLSALREDDRTEALPLVFLTAMDDRENMRRAMSLGADDYLTKPFSREDVLQVVKVRMARAEVAERRQAQRLLEREQQLKTMFQNTMRGQTQDRCEMQAVEGTQATEVREATVLFSAIHGFTTIAEQFCAQEVAELLDAYFRAVCEPVLAAGGEALRFIGDGVMAVFSTETCTGTTGAMRRTHAYRGLQAALGMNRAAERFNTWIEHRFPDRGLPPFAIGVGVHSGEVMMCHVGSGAGREYTAIGDTVNLASRLEGKTLELGWPVIASLPTLRTAGRGVSFGQFELLHIRGRDTPVEAAHITGIEAGDFVNFGEPRSAGDRRELSAALRSALQSNAEITGRAVKVAQATARHAPVRMS